MKYIINDWKGVNNMKREEMNVEKSVWAKPEVETLELSNTEFNPFNWKQPDGYIFGIPTKGSSN